MIAKLVVLTSFFVAVTHGFNKDEWLRNAGTQDPENSSSYLDWPRIHFSGSVLTDVPTVNNLGKNFDIDTFDERLRENSSILGYSPGGSGSFQLKACEVSSVCYSFGECTTHLGEDALIGADLLSNIDHSQAKIVDLDPAYQQASTIFGLTLHIPGFFNARLLEAAIKDLFKKKPGAKHFGVFGSDFMSLLVDVEWENDVKDSQIVSEFRDIAFKSSNPHVLSIKFNIEVDYSGSNFESSGPQIGKIVGTIGLAGTAEPLHALRHRQLTPLEGDNHFGRAYFRVFKNRQKLLIDLANAMKHNLMGLPDPDLNHILQIAYPSGTADPRSCKTEVTVVGQVNYTRKFWYQHTAGVISVPETTVLTLKQLDEISNRPLMIRRLDTQTLQCVQVILAERRDGKTIDFMGDGIFRQDPGDTWHVYAFATQFGRPLTEPLQIRRAKLVDVNNVSDDTIAVNQPANAIQYSNMKAMGKYGIAVFNFTGKSPGNPRRIIDGQIYLFDIQANVNNLVTSNHPIVVRMYDDFRVSSGGPTWHQDIYPIFKLYANMFPSMTSIINLACYEDVRRKTKMMKLAMSLPFTDPAYMPVTRDLSRQKQQAILKWLDNPKIGNSVTLSLEELKKNLQIALEIELATIPPYLTAWFSIKEGHNQQISETLRSIVIQEMLHMTLVANILNSICGNPILDNVGVIPKYPSKLPGGVHPHLTVSLGRLSKGLIEDVFMKIEEPDDTLPITLRQTMLHDDQYEPERDPVWHHHHNTIGQFYYKKIWQLLRDLARVDENLFNCGNNNTQITKDDWYSNIDETPSPVRNIKDAGRAIHKIIMEGEGSSPTNPYDSEGELSHYYKFLEIVIGNKVEIGEAVGDVETIDVKAAANTLKFCGRGDKLCHPMSYTLTGERMPFHDDGIWPIINDPEDHKYPSDSKVKQLSGLFNEEYSNLLRCIHGAFNGNPRRIQTCMSMMARLESLGRQLVRTPIDPNGDPNVGPNGAPTFEFIAVQA
ncbi:uncharacterized protein [Ptychodera flava]|uniref:uncharacterized protein n=1 Tax=Ptychodera flava TaxID=63121 RepID=UPI00396AA969